MKLEIAILALIGLMVVAPLSWRSCVKLVLYMVVVEGAIRKWVVPSASEFVYFAKDGVMVLAYIKYLRAHGGERSLVDRNKLLPFWILCATSFIGLQAMNPHLGSIPVGLVGARNYLLYVPLMFLTQNLFRTQDELLRFLRSYLLLAIPICALAVYQSSMPPDHWINSYATQVNASQRAMLGGSMVRVTGTFSYIAGYASYLQTAAALVIPLLIIQQTPRWRVACMAIMLSIVVGILLSGSRGPVLGLVLLVVGYFALNRVFRALGLYRKFLVPGVIAFLAMSLVLDSALEMFVTRFQSNADIGYRISYMFFGPFYFIDIAGFFGYGAGATYQANPIIRSILGLQEGTRIPTVYESEPERIMLELGPIGFLLWYGLRVFIVAMLWKTYTRLRQPLLRELALTAFLVNLLAIPSQMVFQITFMVYHWFLAGFVFLLPQLEANHYLHAEAAQRRRSRNHGRGIQ